MEIKYSGSISYDIDSVMGLFTDNTMSDDDIREILYGDFCAYDDFEYSILTQNSAKHVLHLIHLL